MKKFIVYLLVIVLVVSLGFAVFYLVRDNEVISISSASIYKDAGDTFTLDVDHINKKSYTEISVSSSDENIVSGRYDEDNGQYQATAHNGGVARINVRTTNAKFRNLWCDVIVGDGSVESPFYISSAEQLAAIGMGAEKEDEPGVFKGAPGYEKYESDLCYKLVSNIDASTINQGYWVPLQNFNGRLDGNGCTISNIYIDAAGYQEALGDKADIRFLPGKDAGFLASVGADAVVYNLKLENYMAKGTYAQFGTITAVNYGTIERIEVKDAYLSIKTALFGGIAGANVSTEELVVNTDEEGNETASFERTIARIDRTSVILTLGEETNVDASGNETKSILGSTGTIGGLVGMNMGGTLVYSYVRGNVYFGDDTTANILYGGVVAKNSALNGMHYDVTDEDESEFQGASIRDCYSDLSTILLQTPASNSLFGGVVGHNSDYQNGTFESPENLRVHNYLIGNYYNKDNLNKAQDGITKDFDGIAKFTLDGKDVLFTDKEMIVYGLTTDEMKVQENFVSHQTIEIQFNSDGTSKGIVERNVLWQFGSVWAIDANTNDGMPYLNYQLIYIPDDFETVGVPVVSDNLNDYYFEIKIDYPVSILSGTDGKVRIKVKEFYQLVYSPTGIEIYWTTSDSSIVMVDEQGKLEGIKPGVATVTATTKSGSQAKVTVIVENIPYRIIAPQKVYLYKGETFDMGNVSVTPAPSGDDTLSYIIGDTSIINWADTQNTTIKASNVGQTSLTIKIADTTAVIHFEVVAAPAVQMTASPKSISGYIDEMAKTGTITITHETVADVDLSYNAKFLSGDGIVEFAFSAYDKSKLNYTIKGVGCAVVRVGIATSGYENSGYVDIYFTIKSETNVALTMSPSSVSGYYNTMSKTGSVTVSNSAGTTLSYSATSNNTNVVTVSTTGNAINYTIRGIGSAVVTVTVTTEHYTGTGYVYFTVMETPVVTETISLNKSDITIYVGDTYTLSATGTFTRLSWSSTNTSAVTVNSSGTVTGKSVGTAIVVAKSDYAEDSCIVRVINRPVVEDETEEVYVSVSPTSVTMNVSSTYKLTASGKYSSISWSSSNTNIATVSSNGTVTSKSSAGTVTITVSAKDSNGTVQATAHCTVTVVKPSTQEEVYISVSPTSVTINTGATYKLTATGKYSSLSWSSSNTSVATVSSNGTVTAKSTAGTATITVAAKDSNGTVKANAYCTVTVVKPSSGNTGGDEEKEEVVYISVSPGSVTLNVGGSYRLTASGNYSSVSWSSSNSSVASVSSGSVYAKKAGSATIVASAKDSSGTTRAYGYCTVTVVSQNVVKVNSSTDIAYEGEVVKFTADSTNSDVVTWECSGPATFVQEGNTLIATTDGTGTISVKAVCDNSSADYTVTVKDEDSYSPYIYNVSQLKAIKNHPDKDYYLAANISVGEWAPFAFTGTLTALADGNNSYFHLTDMIVSETNARAGLFSSVTGATIKNLIIKNSNISGSSYAGGIAGSASRSSFNNCEVLDSTITSAGLYAGGITGYLSGSSVITSCTSKSNAITAINAGGYAGGLVGFATSSAISSSTLNGGSVQATAGYAGGMAGYLTNTRAYNGLVKGHAVIKTSTGSSSCFAGGICGYTNGSGGSYTNAIQACTVSTASITGYYAGGIGGSISSERTVTLKFSDYKNGYRAEDLDGTPTYTTNVSTTAVKTGVTVKGAYVGGLFGVIMSGVVENCYTMASLNGTSITAGFASSISASSGFNNIGGSGTCGLVRYCYSACTFGGSGKYAITASQVHNYASVGDGSGRAGYCMNYVFDDDKDDDAEYDNGSNIFSGDKVKAKKSSSEMQTSSTYTNKGFSATYWNLSGYPSLKTERA